MKRKHALLFALFVIGCGHPDSHWLRAPREWSIQRRLDQAARAESEGRTPEAERAYRDALERDDACAAAYMGIGRLAAAEGRWEDAFEACRRAMQADPSEPAYALAFADAARRWSLTSVEQTKLLKAALRGYLHALSLLPESYEAAMGVGECHLHLAAPKHAIRAFGIAQRLRPHAAAPHAAMAEAHVMLHQFDAAQRDYRWALKLAPDDPALHNAFAAFHLMLSREPRLQAPLARRRAVALYRRSLMLDPHQPDVRRRLQELDAVSPGAVTALDERTY